MHGAVAARRDEEPLAFAHPGTDQRRDVGVDLRDLEACIRRRGDQFGAGETRAGLIVEEQ
jgi:hypothetical protein